MLANNTGKPESLTVQISTCWISWGVPCRGTGVPPLMSPLVTLSSSVDARFAFMYFLLQPSTILLAVALLAL